MRINFCPNVQYFTSNNGYYKSENGNPIGTVTQMFRPDLDWNRFTDFMVKHFKNKDKVQILQFAASDGSEAYTQIITLLENFKGQNIDKFFPIEAYDIDKNMCDVANSGLLNMNFIDLKKFNDNNIDVDKYFEFYSDKNINILNDTSEHFQTYKALPILTENVNFHQGDMFDVSKKHTDDSNTVVLCRNILDYLTDREVENFMMYNSFNLKKGSLFVTGEIDEHRVESIIMRNGFVKVLPHVFMKA